MFSGWTRLIGLIAVAALIANAQCYNTCALAYSAAEIPSNGCHQHHHKSSHEDSSGCQHEHSEFIGPEAGIVKTGVAQAVPVLAVSTEGSALVVIEPPLLSTPDTGSPPGDQVSSALSVLRI